MTLLLDSFLDITEASDLLKVKKSWLYQNHKTLEIPTYQVGRKLLFKRNELINWVEKRRKT